MRKSVILACAIALMVIATIPVSAKNTKDVQTAANTAVIVIDQTSIGDSADLTVLQSASVSVIQQIVQIDMKIKIKDYSPKSLKSKEKSK